MVEGLVAVAQGMAQSRLENDYQMAAMKKTLDMQKQQAAQLLGMLAVSGRMSGEPGGAIDVTV